MEENPLFHEDITGFDLIGSQVFIGLISLMNSCHSLVDDRHFSEDGDHNRSQEIGDGCSQEEIASRVVELVQCLEDDSESEGRDELSVIAQGLIPVRQSNPGSEC